MHTTPTLLRLDKCFEKRDNNNPGFEHLEFSTPSPETLRLTHIRMQRNMDLI